MAETDLVTEEPGPEAFRLWPAVREAIRGSQQDFTSGPNCLELCSPRAYYGSWVPRVQ